MKSILVNPTLLGLLTSGNEFAKQESWTASTNSKDANQDEIRQECCVRGVERPGCTLYRDQGETRPEGLLSWKEGLPMVTNVGHTRWRALIEMETTKQAVTPKTVQPDEKGRFWLFLPNGQKT